MFKNLIKRVSILSCLLVSSFSQGAIIESTLYCDRCGLQFKKSLALNYANSNDAKFIVIDASGANTVEIIVQQIFDPNGGNEDSPDPIVTVYDSKPYLLNMNQSLRQIKDINLALKRMAQIEITLPSDFDYAKVTEVLESSSTQSDFRRVLQNELNQRNAEMQDILRRAENQIELMNSSGSVGIAFFSISLGKIVNASTWVVRFSDGTSITVDISFRMINGELEAKVAVDETTAETADGKDIPLATPSVDGFSTQGDTDYIRGFVKYFEGLGVTVLNEAAHDPSQTCTVTGIECKTDDVCKVKFKCSN